MRLRENGQAFFGNGDVPRVCVVTANRLAMVAHLPEAQSGRLHLQSSTAPDIERLRPGGRTRFLAASQVGRVLRVPRSELPCEQWREFFGAGFGTLDGIVWALSEHPFSQTIVSSLFQNPGP